MLAQSGSGEGPLLRVGGGADCQLLAESSHAGRGKGSLWGLLQ